MSKNEWVIQLSQAYRDLGVSENGIRNLIAKNALESGWGQSTQGRYNYGNITTGSSWGGSYVNGRDHDANGNPIRNKFRSYNSLREFAADEIQFLKRLYDFNDSDNIDTFLSKL
ncbi:MAG: glucosaminidase domain-containing protein [Bacilli bacterium]|nr:glucosaminidase domain-containing protein [Bacilli bacterium]